MTGAFAGTLHLTVRASPTQRLFVVIVHGMAAVVGCLLVAQRPWLAILIPLITASAVREWRRASGQRAGDIVRLRWADNDALVWQTLDSRWHEGHLVHAYASGTWLVALVLAEDGHRLQRRHCLLLYDSLSARAHRHLRARLTVRGVPRPSADD